MKRQRLLVWLARFAILAALLAGWQWGVHEGFVSTFFFGSPIGIGLQIIGWFSSGEIYEHLYVTLLETVLAFVVGTALALVLGLWLALSRFWAQVFDPFIKGINAMPRLILAPIFTLWFGLEIWSKVALGVTLVFFVVFFNVFQGIREVSPVLIANTRMLGASRAQLIRRVYIPSAMSWVFSSLHLSVGTAFIGAVIGEYLGSSRGVGYLILQAEGTFDTNGVLAGVLVLTIFALLLDALITWVENRLLAWRPSDTN